MEFEKLQGIIAEVLNVDADEITPDTTFVDDLGADYWMFSRSLWELRKSLILRFRRRRQRRLFLSAMRQRQSRLQSVEHYRKEELKEGLLQEPLFHL